MEYVIMKYMEIGGNVQKVFYNIELIMIRYLHKVSIENDIEYLGIARCFCNILLDNKFYIEENIINVEGLFDCLSNTVINPYEFITTELLNKMCNLSEFIFTYEETKPSLIKSYCKVLSHFIGNCKLDKDNTDKDNNYVNFFFDILLEYMEKIGFDENKVNDKEIIMTIEEIVNDNNENIFQNKTQNDIIFICIFHYIKLLHIYELIKFLNEKNKKLLLNNCLYFFGKYLNKDIKHKIKQQIAKLILIIKIEYYIQTNTSENNNENILKEEILKLKCSPIVIETIISTIIITNTFEDKFTFHNDITNITFNTNIIPHKYIIFLFQVIYLLMEQNVNVLLRQHGRKLLNEFIEIYALLKKCFDNILNNYSDTKEFYNDFFSVSESVMINIYELYFRIFTENEDIFKQISSFYSSSPEDNKFQEFKLILIEDIIQISQKLLIQHMNPFIHKLLLRMFSKVKDDNIEDLFELIIRIMKFFIDKLPSYKESNDQFNKECYLLNLISFYTKLNKLLSTKDIIVTYIYKKNVKLFSDFVNILKETFLIYTLIGIEIENSTFLISEVIFDNYINMYLINNEPNDEQNRITILAEFNKIIYIQNKKDNLTICHFLDIQTKDKKIINLIKQIQNTFSRRNYNILNGINISMLFLTKSVLHIYYFQNSHSLLTNQIKKFLNFIIMELSSQNKKIEYTKHTLYNKFIELIESKHKKQNIQSIEKIYEQLILNCQLKYQNSEECKEDILKFKAFDLNNFSIRTPIRKNTKNLIAILSPPQTQNQSLHLSADAKNKGKKTSTKNELSFENENSPLDNTKRKMSMVLEQENEATNSNDFQDFVLNVQNVDTKRNALPFKRVGIKDEQFKRRRSDFRPATTIGLRLPLIQNKMIKITKNKKRNTSSNKNTIPLHTFKQLNKNFSLINPKQQILLTHFAIEFKDIYFYSESFIKMKHAYFIYTQLPYIQQLSKQLNYPSKVKNFSNTIEPPLFLTYNKHFFTGKYLNVSHHYIKKQHIHENKIPFQQKELLNDSNLKNKFKCELINTDHSIYGNIAIYNNFILFQSSIDDPRLNINPEEKIQYIFSSAKGDHVLKDKTILIYYSEIKEILIRRFLFFWQSIEIYTLNGKSFFFNFFKESNFSSFIKKLPIKTIEQYTSLITLDKKKIMSKINEFQTKWIENQITTYEYLLILNKLSGRSYKDVNQYPIIPWLLTNYENIFNLNFGINVSKKETKNKEYIININENEYLTINENIYKSDLRNLEYPISVQTIQKREIAIMKYKESKLEEKFPYHLGSFYSTSSYIFYYLMRMQPHMDCLIRLQNGSQENPNRMFYSFADTQEVLANSTDNRELIPEIYAKIEFLLNLNCSFFGIRMQNQLIDDVIYKNNSLSNFIHFLMINRKLLNSSKIAKCILPWIDYTFGINQISNKENSCTVFSRHSYEQRTDFNKKLQSIIKKNKPKNKGKVNYEDVYKKLSDKVLIVLNFGQAPFQIFNTAHPCKNQLYNEKHSLFEEDNELKFNDITIHNENGIIEMLSKLEETIPHKIVMKSQIEIICGDYNENGIIYSMSLNGQLFINYNDNSCVKGDNKKEKNFHLPGFHLKNRKIINLLIKNNESINYPEYSYCIMNNDKLIITCGYLSNAFQLYDIQEQEHKYSNYMMETFVRAICKLTETSFLIGLNNGKLIEYEIFYNEQFKHYICQFKRCVYGHSLSIYIIEYIPKLEIIITVGDDNYIYIRKFYDFELLTYIALDSKYKVMSIKVSEVNCLYVLVYDKTQPVNKMKVIGYTLNGIKFAQSDYGMFTNMEISNSNNVILGIDENGSCDKKEMNHITVLKGSSLTCIGNVMVKNCSMKSVVYVKYCVKKKMIIFYFKDEIRISMLEDEEKEAMVF